MRARASSLLLRAEPPSRPAGVVVTLRGVAAITVLIFPLRTVDRGPGNSPGEITRIFEPFYRPASDRTAYRGSGLALAIVRGFVEANGGRVWAESLPGQGAMFVVALPLEVDGEAMEGPTTRAAAP